MTQKQIHVCDYCKAEQSGIPFNWGRVEIYGADLNTHKRDMCPDCWTVAERAVKNKIDWATAGPKGR